MFMDRALTWSVCCMESSVLAANIGKEQATVERREDCSAPAPMLHLIHIEEARIQKAILVHWNTLTGLHQLQTICKNDMEKRQIYCYVHRKRLGCVQGMPV